MAKKKKKLLNEHEAMRAIEAAVEKKVDLAPIVAKLQAEMETNAEAVKRIAKE